MIALIAGEAIRKVPIRQYGQSREWKLYGSALTGFRYGKNLLLLGMPGSILSSMPSHRLACFGRISPQFGGSAVVQLLPWAFGSGRGHR